MNYLDNCLLVLPEGTKIPDNFEYPYHIMKFLHTPSIVSSERGIMNTTNTTVSSTGDYIKRLLGVKNKVLPDVFLRHVRIRNPKNGEYYHNKGATFLIHLNRDTGSFQFSYAICNHEDTFNKLIAHNVCDARMDNEDCLECINYDPSISIIQNIYLAVGVELGEYSLTDYDWTDILPELTGSFTDRQRKELKVLRGLIRRKLQGTKH